MRFGVKVGGAWAKGLFQTISRLSVPLLIASAALTGTAAQALDGQGPTISLAALPPPGVETYRSIQRGGPFPFEKDGVVFGNRERILPLQKRGYYREYTVKTPGSRNRGAQRIVCGGPATTPDACYYTADHYASFRMIVP